MQTLIDFKAGSSNASGLCRESFTQKHLGFQAADVEQWVRLTGDANPIHTSSSAAEEAGALLHFIAHTHAIASRIWD